MNTAETAKYTGIPTELLVELRTRNMTFTLRSGPPYTKKYDKNGVPEYVYNKTQVKAWMGKMGITLSAGEAARRIGITVPEIMRITGTKRFDFRRYFIVVEPKKNRFYMVLKKGRKKK